MILAFKNSKNRRIITPSTSKGLTTYVTILTCEITTLYWTFFLQTSLLLNLISFLWGKTGMFTSQCCSGFCLSRGLANLEHNLIQLWKELCRVLKELCRPQSYPAVVGTFCMPENTSEVHTGHLEKVQKDPPTNVWSSNFYIFQLTWSYAETQGEDLFLPAGRHNMWVLSAASFLKNSPESCYPLSPSVWAAFVLTFCTRYQDLCNV